MRYSTLELLRLKQSADLYGRICQHTTLRKSGRLYSGKCPFPDHDDRNASFVFDPEKNSFRCYSTACGRSGSVIDWMMEFEGYSSFADAVETLGGAQVARDQRWQEKQQKLVQDNQRLADARAANSQEKARQAAHKIFSSGRELAGSVAETYLREARGLGDVLLPGAVLRFAADLPYWAEIEKDRFEIIHRGPALLAAFQNKHGRFAAVHQTWLKSDGSGKITLSLEDGTKLPAKKIRGPYMGASLRLGPPAPVMGLGEGVETCLSCMPFGLSCWCAGSLGNLVGAGKPDGICEPHPERTGHLLPTRQPDMASHRAFLPFEARSMIVLADSDTKDLEALKAQLERSVRRLRFEERSARILWPPLGMDMNDWILANGRDAA
ncbi:CHC2 zinc finger [Pseudovibrio ascidiaceicola]|uniref:CHC2 zinc finger n=1 Tax=Pseudovibrio ascidiaceicola TaxID=285279 RepID=A0A1I4E2Z2_9HYPH|nr:CHC2 zinc finger domain-containing protein [Pseudovibrio ascidiaceicola]SFK98541.1 CHC2 zinc finger [Pseudovibrio ascidiaceicola]